MSLQNRNMFRICLAVALIGIGVLQLGFRGLQRVHNDIPLWDFASVHAASQTWLHDGNPYDLPAVLQTWKQQHIFSGRDASYFATVYPPTSLALMAPLALLPAGPAMLIWLFLCVSLLAWQWFATIRLVGLTQSRSLQLLFVGAALASAPTQFGILSGQLSVPAISLAILAICYAQRRSSILAGTLLGIACGLKPQIAAPFVVFYLFLRNWKLVGTATAVGGAIAAVALIGMHAAHVDWITGWKHSVALTTLPGAVNDYGSANLFRDEMIDLKMLFSGITTHTMSLQAAAVVATLVLVGWYLSVLTRDVTLNIAVFGALILLPIYHRVYDVGLLSLALAWTLAQLDGAHRRQALMLLCPMAIFLIPFDAVKSFGSRIPHLTAISRSSIWQAWIAPHYAWGLLATTIVLLGVMTHRKPSMLSDA